VLSVRVHLLIDSLGVGCAEVLLTDSRGSTARTSASAA
jgi:hypothetical protein